jgi:hypothetical protein
MMKLLVPAICAGLCVSWVAVICAGVPMRDATLACALCGVIFGGALYTFRKRIPK